VSTTAALLGQFVAGAGDAAGVAPLDAEARAELSFGALADAMPPSAVASSGETFAVGGDVGNGRVRTLKPAFRGVPQASACRLARRR
jgi:hypothetical protein